MANQNDMSATTGKRMPRDGERMVSDMQRKCDEGEHYMHGSKECMKDSEMPHKGDK